jgi:UDP-N-acetylglucosamine acyltransferase
VEIGNNNVLMNSVTVLYGARIGHRNIFFPGAVIGAIPQDLKFQGEDTVAIIGNDNKIRENVTINRGTASKGWTMVGNGNLLMETVHVGHDTAVGNGCIIGNGTKLAGEVTVDDNAIISANVLVHQFCRVGGYVMVGGGTRTAQDIPPFITAAREPVAFCGLNLVGLRRRGFSNELIENIHQAYRLVYQSGLKFNDAIERIKNEIPMTKEIEYIVEFLTSSKRGFIH